MKKIFSLVWKFKFLSFSSLYGSTIFGNGILGCNFFSFNTLKTSFLSFLPYDLWWNVCCNFHFFPLHAVDLFTVADIKICFHYWALLILLELCLSSLGFVELHGCRFIFSLPVFQSFFLKIFFLPCFFCPFGCPIALLVYFLVVFCKSVSLFPSSSFFFPLNASFGYFLLLCFKFPELLLL